MKITVTTRPLGRDSEGVIEAEICDGPKAHLLRVEFDGTALRSQFGLLQNTISDVIAEAFLLGQQSVVQDAAERVREAAKRLNFKWLEADANDAAERPRELSPWCILAAAALGMDE